MTDSLFIRYAVALLDVAIEENKVEEYLEEAFAIVNICQENQNLCDLLKDYGLSVEEKKDVIKTIFEKRINQHIFYFMYIILDNQRGKYFQQFFNEFIQQAQKYLHISYGICYTTQKMDEKTLHLLEEKVSKIYHGKVILNNQIDSSLIGGFKIVIDDFIIDESIQNKMNQLKSNLIQKKGDAKQ